MGPGRRKENKLSSQETVTESFDSDYPRSWDWPDDGELVGRYVETRSATIGDGTTQALIDFKLVETSEPVTVWLTPTVLRNRFAEELKRRIDAGKDDFEPGERIRIRRGSEKRPSTQGDGYWPFTVEFEFAHKPTAASILLADDAPTTDDAGDELPF